MNKEFRLFMQSYHTRSFLIDLRGNTDQDQYIINQKKPNPAVWTRVITVRHQKSSLCSMETKPPRRTTVVHVSTSKPRPLTPINRYPMNIA